MFWVLFIDYEGSEICKGVGEIGNKIIWIFFYNIGIGNIESLIGK